MQILVSGGLGFIGSNFIHYLLDETEASVANLDSASYGSNPLNLQGVSGSRRYKFVKGDISDFRVVKPLIEESDAVVNLAAETHVDRSISSGAPFMNANIMGAFTIMECLRRVGKRVSFVQVGTDEEYGEIMDGSFTESDPLSPSSPYAASKASASMVVLAYARTYGLDAKVTRCTNNFGPYQFPEKLIPKSIIRARLGLNVPVYGKGENVRDWIHVGDHCRALELVLRKGQAGNVYNVAGGVEVKNIDLVRMLLGVMGASEHLIELVEDRPGHDRRYSLNDMKIRKDLGWRPKREFSESLRETVEWYLKNERWWRPIADGKTLNAAPWKLKW